MVGEGFDGSNVKFLKLAPFERLFAENKEAPPPSGMTTALEFSGGQEEAERHLQPGASGSPTAHNV